MDRWVAMGGMRIGAAVGAFWLAVSAQAGPTAAPTAAPKPVDRGFLVLCYHRFVARPETVRRPLSEYRLPVAEFRWQMQYLKDQGITPISMDQLRAYWKEGKPLPERAVLLTFDDGFRSIYEKAYPVVKEFGYPGVLFLYTDFIRGQVDSMRYSEIEEMGRNGFDLESHTKSHMNLGLESEKRSPGNFEALLTEELGDPLRFLQEKFKVQSRVLAYSYGVYNEEVLKKTGEAGYELAFTVNPGPNDRTVPPLQLRRNLVLYPTKHENFAAIFKDQVLHLSGLAPGDGKVLTDSRPLISGKILDEVDPKSIRLVLGAHRMAVQYDPKTGMIRHKVQADLKSGGHMLTLSALDRQGQKRVYSWYFRVRHKKFLKKDEENIGPPILKGEDAREMKGSVNL